MKSDALDPASALQSRAPDLTTLAHQLLIEMLERHGNGVCEDHSLALWQLMTGFTEQGLHIRNGRFAYALPCGAGKTLSVVAWIAAQYKLGLGLSVAVSAQQIASLCIIKKALIDAGVPESRIGIRHTHGAAADYPDTGVDERQIMLGSHSRIRGKDEMPAFCSYKGALRDLLIWDETLLSTDATTLVLNDADTGLMHFAKDEKHPLLRAALSKLQNAMQLERARQEKGAARLLTLLTESESEAALAELGTPVYGSQLDRSAFDAAEKAIRLMKHPISLLDAGAGLRDVVLMRYQVAIDPELRNIAVLDASYVVSELCKADPTIRNGSTSVMLGFKQYSHVLVKQAVAATGRSKFDGTRAERADAVKAAIQSIAGIPNDHRILVITYKNKEKGRKDRDLIALLRDELESAGINCDAVLPDGKPRVSFTTWGKHTTDNSFVDCEHVVVLGVLRMPLASLAAALAGQKRDELFRLSKPGLLAVELSELASNVMQAMNRGACRRVDSDGNAASMTLHLHTKEKELQQLLQTAMPGLQWEIIEVKPPTKTEEATRHIVQYLLSCSAGRISNQRLFSDLNIQLGKDGKAEAMAGAMVELREHAWHRFEFPWIEERRSLVRKATQETPEEFLDRVFHELGMPRLLGAAAY